MIADYDHLQNNVLVRYISFDYDTWKYIHKKQLTKEYKYIVKKHPSVLSYKTAVIL